MAAKKTLTSNYRNVNCKSQITKVHNDKLLNPLQFEPHEILIISIFCNFGLMVTIKYKHVDFFLTF